MVFSAMVLLAVAQAFPQSNVCNSEFPYLGIGTKYRLDSTVESDQTKRVSHNYSYDSDGNPVNYRINANYTLNFPTTATIEFKNRVAK